MLALNVRHPRDFRGDLAAQIGAARLGEQRLDADIAEFGGATLAAPWRRCWTPRNATRARSSRAGGTASTRARACSMTTVTAPTNIAVRATRHHAGQRRYR